MIELLYHIEILIALIRNVNGAHNELLCYFLELLVMNKTLFRDFAYFGLIKGEYLPFCFIFYVPKY